MMDTEYLIKWGLITVGGVMGLAVIMLGAEAIVHDGEVATTIVQQLIGVLIWGMPVIGGVLGIHQLSSAYVKVKQASATATVQTAQATAGAQPAPTSDPVAVAGSAL